MDNEPGFTILFDLQRDGADVWRALTGQADADGLIDLVQGMRNHPPIAPTCEPFERGPEFRPSGQMRTFYRRLQSGHIAIKGSEPLASRRARRRGQACLGAALPQPHRWRAPLPRPRSA
jgi:hypothetical protein